MLAVPIPRRARKPQDDHVRPEAADHPHHVAQNLIVTPLLEGFLRRLGEAEIDRAREKLLRPVDSSRGQQLLGADHSQRVPLLGANQILAALAPRQRKISGAHVSPPRQVCQQRRVLIVRMRRDHQRASHNVQAVQCQLGLGRS